MTETTEDTESPLKSSPALQGERVSFTGTLASMTHREAMELVEQLGGIPMQHISHLTSILVVGEEGWPLEPDGQPSQKLEQAQQLCDQGQPLQIVTESEWLKWIGIEPPERKVNSLLTPAMLHQLLGVPVHEIRRWERAGLIKPVKKIFRLPYFDFDEVANARRLCELAASGLTSEQIANSLKRLAIFMPGVSRPLEQLEVLARGSVSLVYRDHFGPIETSGQRLFDFDPPLAHTDDDLPETIPLRPSLTTDSDHREKWSDSDWFDEGCRLIDSNEPNHAIEAFRLAIISEPSNPSYHFHLADALYRVRRPEAAIERYHMAVELDHHYLEAWTQLGCVLSETGDQQGAKTAFQIALDLHPDFPEAHFHLAGVFEQLELKEEACHHWREYLKYDQRGPWAEIARERLS